MWTAVIFAGMNLQPRGADQQYYDNLLHWREQFETDLKEPTSYAGYIHVQSEMLGGGHGDAMYPIGSAAERYLLSFDEMSAGGILFYEKRRGNKAIVMWSLPFVPVKKTRLVGGTVRECLMAQGFAISPKVRLTHLMRKQLSKTGYFAYYSFHPMMGGYARVVNPDGTRTKTIRTEGRFFITEVEKKLIQQAKINLR